MATVVEVETAKPNVYNVTLKLSKGEARDVLLFANEWYARNAYSGDVKTHGVYKAITKALAGETDDGIVTIRPF